MLKKTLIAAAITSLVSVPAMATSLSVVTGADTTFTANTLALQTKQSVLDKTSLDAKITVTVDNTAAGTANDEIKNGGELVYVLNGDAFYNQAKISDMLSISATAETVQWPGLSINVSNTAAGTISNTVATIADIKKLFKVDEATDGTTTTYTIRHSVDNNNQRLSLVLADDLSSTLVYDTTGPTSVAINAARIGVTLDFSSTALTNVFKLTAGSSSTVTMTVGSLLSASYTANPKTTDPLFQTKDLFTLSQTALTGTQDATAQVSNTYTSLNTGSSTAIRGVSLVNNSTLQSIQTSELNLYLIGDFSGLSLSNAQWTGASTGTAKVTYSTLTSDVTIPGNNNATTYSGYPLSLPNFVVAADNKTSIEAQSFKLKAEITSGSFTFNPYSYEIANAFVISRDGMKFDTVTTGTTSSNVIYIRDVSKNLPTEGGKIFVTITEYDAHAADANANGTDLVTRAVLPTRLPSNGAVTLTPAGVAQALGVSINPARQARFFFEVETNQGEAAVKKATSGGVDIQTGRSQSVTDFTL